MKPVTKFQVAFVGNHQFDIPLESRFSTETDLAWTFEQLGWRVIRLQENHSTTDDWLAAGLDSDLLLWVSTHGWVPGGSISREGVLARLKECGIPTVAMHLDRWFGIPDREPDLSVNPMFKCEYVYTADGGHQAEFAALGVNHIWSPPAICARHCYLGQIRDEYVCDVVFVGSRYYHPCYPFRRELIDWLDSKDREFRVMRWGGDRPGQRAELNDIYASARVVIGDSIFAGADRYVSDRLFETTGRGGFIVHPRVPGLEMTGVGDYLPQDLHDLDNVVKYYLTPENQAKREQMRMAAYEFTRKWHTYTNRILVVLNNLGLN